MPQTSVRDLECQLPRRRKGVKRGQKLRPRGLAEDEVFSWFTPGEPPEDGCWDWGGNLEAKGYGRFGMNGGKRMVLAHRAAYRKFIGPIPGGANILHSCDRPICVQPKHLSVGTKLQNIRECIERGRFPVGERQGQAKLTEADVAWIRTCGLSLRVMSEILGVSNSNISRIRQRKAWAHVP